MFIKSILCVQTIRIYKMLVQEWEQIIIVLKKLTLNICQLYIIKSLIKSLIKKISLKVLIQNFAYKYNLGYTKE